MTLSCSTVVDLSKQPCPIVTYLPMDVAAERPVGDVLHQASAICYQDSLKSLLAEATDLPSEGEC